MRFLWSHTMVLFGNRSSLQSLSLAVAMVGATLAFAPQARAAFHLWDITEIYTNASGTLQFIEMRNLNDNENFVNGQSIQVSNIPNSQTNTFMIPGSALPGFTSNRSLLFG